jgi:hypothetical protein
MQEARCQCPDILAYKSDYSDYFFIEVKGDKDSLRNGQTKHFQRLSKLTEKPVKLMKFLPRA